MGAARTIRLASGSYPQWSNSRLMCDRICPDHPEAHRFVLSMWLIHHERFRRVPTSRNLASCKTTVRCPSSPVTKGVVSWYANQKVARWHVMLVGAVQ